MLDYNTTAYLGPLGLAGAKATVGGAESYLKNGIINLSEGRSFNQGAVGAASGGAVSGLVSYGISKAPNLITKNPVGRLPEAPRAVVNYFTGNAGVNSGQSLLREGVKTTAMFTFGQGLSALGSMPASSGSGGASGNQSVSSRTASAGSYAQGVNVSQAVKTGGLTQVSSGGSGNASTRSTSTTTSSTSSSSGSSSSSGGFWGWVSSFFSRR